MAPIVRIGQNIRGRANQMQNNFIELQKMVARELVKELVEGTPVDTGFARSNWLVSLYTPTRSVIAPYAPGMHLGINEVANRAGAIAAANVVLNRLRPNKSFIAAGRAIIIKNNVDYIDDLRGISGPAHRSPQQKSDWVSLAVNKAFLSVRGFRLLGP